MNKENNKIHNTKEQVDEFIHSQENLSLLRFITCGSVDDGKSTLIGRVLFESQSLFDDQIRTLKKDSKKHGTQGSDIDYALSEAHTQYGRIGVKVWICKGEVFGKRDLSPNLDKGGKSPRDNKGGNRKPRRR